MRDGSSYLITLGERIRALRARRGMTRRTLAVQSGVSERFLAEVESGTGNPSVLTLRQLANALDMKMEMLANERLDPSLEFAHATQLLQSLNEA